VNASKLCVFVAMSDIVVILTAGITTAPNVLQCAHHPEPEFGGVQPHRMELRYKHDFWQLGYSITAFGLLVVVFILQSNCKWTSLLTFENDVEVRHIRRYFTEGNCRFVKCGFDATMNDDLGHGEFLKAMRLKRLEEIEHDGYSEDPQEAFQRSTWNGPVTMHFSSCGSGGNVLPNNQHRRVAIIFLSIGFVGMLFASQSCWSCVAGIHGIQDTPVMELQMQLHLLGACGRHHFLGKGSLCSASILFVSLILQMTIVRLTDASNNGGIRARELYRQYPKWQHCQHLLMKVFDSVGISPSISKGDDADYGNRNEIYDFEFYENAGLEMPEFWSFVWVTRGEDDDEDDEQVCDGSDRACLPDERATWLRSKQPKKVRLSKQKTWPNSFKRVEGCASGLLRDNCGLPVLWVEILDHSPEALVPVKSSDMTDLLERTLERNQPNEASGCFKQLIPRQFIAGRSHIWLNLGPRHAWERLSAGLAFVAFLIGLVELAFVLLHPRGKFLATCNDILNSPCIYINSRQTNHQPTIFFRHAVGVIAAAIGAGAAMLAGLCLRVANEVDLGERGGVCAYLRALYYIIKVLFTFMRLACGSLRACCIVAWKRSRRRINHPATESAADESSAVYTYSPM